MKTRTKRDWQLSLLQGAAAAAFIGIAFGAASLIDSTLLLTSFGASACIAFTFPLAQSAKPRYMLGGYALACGVGMLFWLCRRLFAPGASVGATVCCTGAVLAVVCLMALLDLGHPPGVAVALTIVLAKKPLGVAAVALVGMILLCLCRLAFLKLVDKAGLSDTLLASIKKKH